MHEANGGECKGAREELERIVAHIRRCWPQVRILVRADSGFRTDELMSWCEANEVDYVFGMARNKRLLRRLQEDLDRAGRQHDRIAQPMRRFKDFTCRTLKSWSRRRRVIGKAAHLPKGPDPRFVLTSLNKRQSTHASSTNRPTVRVVIWRIASKSSSCTCSPTGPPATACTPISCA